MGLIRIGPDQVIEHANEAAHVFLSRRRGSLMGRSVMEAFLDHRAEAVITGETDPGAGGLEFEGPERRRLVLRARPDRSDPGSTWVLLEDVTELRRLQRIRAEFIDNLSHELRTPLTSAGVLAETLNREA